MISSCPMLRLVIPIFIPPKTDVRLFWILACSDLHFSHKPSYSRYDQKQFFCLTNAKTFAFFLSLSARSHLHFHWIIATVVIHFHSRELNWRKLTATMARTRGNFEIRYMHLDELWLVVNSINSWMPLSDQKQIRSTKARIFPDI